MILISGGPNILELLPEPWGDYIGFVILALFSLMLIYLAMGGVLYFVVQWRHGFGLRVVTGVVVVCLTGSLTLYAVIGTTFFAMGLFMAVVMAFVETTNWPFWWGMMVVTIPGALLFFLAMFKAGKYERVWTTFWQWAFPPWELPVNEA